MEVDRSIREVRLDKLEQLRTLGFDPFRSERFERSHGAQELLDRFDELVNEPISFAGRIVSFRPMGKAGFAHLSDGETKIQCYFRAETLGEGPWQAYNLLDLGDHIGVKGELMLTKTGEKTIAVNELLPLSKALEPLPIGKERDGQQWYGISDPELRYRHRHLDLIANPEARKALVNRMKITSSVRRFFDLRGYLEAETPVLQVVAGGAAARPFMTHLNAMDLDVKLRISLELYLKRLICGDLPKVYEIGRVFRNEGLSNRHNPEFTLLEFYQAFADMHDMMMLVEDLFRHVSQEVFGSSQVVIEGLEIDFSEPWQMVDLMHEIELHSGVTAAELSDIESAKKAFDRVGLPSESENSLGGMIEKLLERFVEPTLQQPTFVVGYPLETSPLAKKDPDNPAFTRRFEGYIRGREICNAFSEINDPIDQRERFEQQVLQRAKGDDEAHPMDEDFLYALECGMPPTGGCGIGIDRMAMILTGADHIRETLLFPMMRP